MKNVKIAFAASSGGHLEQLLMLEPLMKKYDSFLVTEKTKYSISHNELKTYYLRQVNRREILFPIKLICNFFRSFYILLKERPTIIITTGVLSIIPLALLVKLFKGKMIYIESFAKVSTKTLSGKFLYKYADQFYVQWEDMLKLYPDAIFKGGIY